MRETLGPAASGGQRQERSDQRLSGLLAVGGVLGALGASSCCVLPLIFFGLGISGAWIGNLTALAPFQPLFVAAALGFLGAGFWRTYRKQAACDGPACARPAPNRLVKASLWGVAVLVCVAVAFPHVVPLLLS